MKLAKFWAASNIVSLCLCAGHAVAANDIQALAGGNANKLLALQFLELSGDPAKRLEAVAKYCAPGYINYRESKAERSGQAVARSAGPPPGGAPQVGGQPGAPSQDAAPPSGGARATGAAPAQVPSETVYRRVLADGDYVSVFYTKTGGPAAGKPITNFMGRQGGPQVANMAVDIYHIINGKITEKWTLVEAIDTLDMVQ